MTEQDDELLRLVATGDRDAFAELYARYKDHVYRFAFQMSGRATVAEDITHDTFLAVLDGAHRFRPEQARFGTYIYGVVRHMVRRRLFRDRVVVTLTGFATEGWRSREPIVEDALVAAATQRHDIARVRRAVLSLPHRYREVVVLCDLHGRDYVEAARVIGCKVGTVRSRLHRGRELLRHKLRVLVKPLENSR